MAAVIISVVIVITVVSIIVFVVYPLSRETSGERTAIPLFRESTSPSVPTTTSIKPEEILLIQYAVFYLSVLPRPINESSWEYLIGVELQLTVKNISNRTVYITRIEVDRNWSLTPPRELLIVPGMVLTETFTVFLGVPYTPAWDRGTDHTVVVYFRVEGLAEELSVSTKATVI